MEKLSILKFIDKGRFKNYGMLSNMKFFITHTYYEVFLDEFYRAHPELKSRDYEAQRASIFAEHFGEADAYSRNLKKFGHQAEEFILNVAPLQRQWALEHGLQAGWGWPMVRRVPYVRRFFKEWFLKVLEEQVAISKPDIFFTDGIISDVSFLQRIKKKVKLVVGQLGSSPPPRQYLECYDLIVSPVPWLVEQFRSFNIHSEYWRLGFDEAVLPRLSKASSLYQTVFVGGFSQFHRERITFFEKLAQEVPIDFWGMGTDHLESGSPILQHHHGPAWGMGMYNILRNAKIVINIHVDMAKQYAANLRLYEATGVGAFLLTDYKENLNDLFTVGKEVEAYRSSNELIEKINYYLGHEAERAKIALAGQQRTLRDHSYSVRLPELVALIEKYL